MKTQITALDIESSGFEGYPIQIGIIKENGNKYQTFIKPSEKWLKNLEWNEDAELIHLIKQDYVIENGVDIEKVAQEINRFVDGDDVYVDSHYDVMWINLLFDEVQMKKLFKIHVLHEILSDEFCEHWAGVFHMEQKESGLKLHNALNDAILIQRTYKRIAAHF